MAIIQQQYLFSWKNFQKGLQNLGDLERLRLVLETIPDKKLISTLQFLRGNGRDDYPIPAVWNSILAGIIYEHSSIESLRRELQRNAQLREMCGFNPLSGANAVPTEFAYCRFLTTLLSQEQLIREMFDCLVKELTDLVPNFGKNLAGDGKIIKSFGKPSKKDTSDRRRENEADWGLKKYKGVGKEGKACEKVKSWFGFRLHLLVEADAELPISYTVTKASKGEQPVMHELIDDLKEKHPKLLDLCEHAMFDRRYDSKALICRLWKNFGIKAVIDIRNMLRDL